MPSGITRTSSSTPIRSAPREHRTTSSLAFNKVTLATVGSLLRGRKTAVPAWSTNALALEVENAAVPPVSVALGAPFSSPQTTRDEPVSTKRAAPALICRLPACSVSSLSPAKTVEPAEAAAVPTWARSAETTVPKPKGEPPKVDVASKLIDNTIDRVTDRLPRARGIFVSMRATSQDSGHTTSRQSVNTTYVPKVARLQHPLYKYPGWWHCSVAVTMPLLVWLIGNRLLLVFAALALEKTPPRSSLTSIKKRATLWSRLSWPSILRLLAKMAKPPNGTPPPPNAFVALTGRPRLRRLLFVSAQMLPLPTKSPNPMNCRLPRLSFLLPSPACPLNKTPQPLKRLSRRQLRLPAASSLSSHRDAALAGAVVAAAGIAARPSPPAVTQRSLLHHPPNFLV